jgi:prepilin peptidase CpaA
MFLELAIMFVFPALMAFAGATDLFTMTIPNRVSIGLVAGFVCFALFAGLGWEAIALHFGVGLAMLVICIGMFAMGWIGGGDAKLFAATSLWMGQEYIFDYTMIAAVLGGVLTLAILALRMYPLPAGLTSQSWLVRLHNAGQGVPYGIALAISGLIVYPKINWIHGLI